MSIQSWKKEFFKTGPASEAAANSLKKWEGLRPANLKKHELKKVKGNAIKNRDGRELFIGCDNCELCKHFYSSFDGGCEKCPISKVTGEDCANEYINWMDDHGAGDMIKLLKKAAKWEKSKSKSV